MDVDKKREKVQIPALGPLDVRDKERKEEDLETQVQPESRGVAWGALSAQ